MAKNLYRTFLKGKLGLILLLVVGSLLWSFTMVRSGWIYSFGMGFWGANGHDGIWHIALIEGLIKSIIATYGKGPFLMPIFAGEILQNYHIGFDLLVAFLHIETGIAVRTLYFQVLPPVFALLIGALTYIFTFTWTKSDRSAFLSTFFVYFGGGLGWLVTLIRSGTFDGESMFWSQQAISTLINPPYAMSLILILSGLICLLKFEIASHKTIYIVLASVFFGLLIEIKVYAGILVLGGLFIASVWSGLKEKKYNLVIIFLISLSISAMLFFGLGGKNPQNLIVFQPFWFLETMMALSDRFGWPRFHSAMTTYRMGGIWLKAAAAYLVALFIFLIGNLGTRAVFITEIYSLIRGKTKLDYLKVFILSIVAAGVVIPMFFLQKGTPWNTIQFFYYSLFFLAILSGIAASHIKKGFLIILILLTIPTTIGAMKHYLTEISPAVILPGELEALDFLRGEPDGIVLTYPFDPVKATEAEANPPRPLYMYDSTAYVSALSAKTTFLEDQVNLDITGYDWKARLTEIEGWYKEPNQKIAREFLKKNNIRYVYWLKGDKRYLYATQQRGYLGETELGIERIFENKEVDIYVVKL